MDAFISYSRKDKTFAQELHQMLTDNQKESWIDWKDIPATADWWVEIQEGIEAANAFVFVISPDSISSEVCQQELEHAVRHNKRLIPLVYREAKNVPKVLGHLNWIFFRETDDFESAFKNLIEVMETDLDWVKQHTRLTQRAVEWEKRERNDSYLLRGDDLAEAEQYLSQVNCKPGLTQLQQEYIVTSQQKQAAELLHELEQAKTLAETERHRLEEQKQYNAQLRTRSMIIIGSLLLVIAVGIFAAFRVAREGMLSRSAEEVVEAIVEFGDAGVNSDVCWAGAIYGVADIVIDACEQAVTLNPDVSYYYESRGVARALMGEMSAAGADLKMAIEIAREGQQGADRIEMWQAWAQQIEQGQNPFDQQTLNQLRDDWRAENELHRQVDAHER